MSRKIITTVGTSLVENLRLSRISSSLKDRFSNAENIQEVLEDFKNNIDAKLSSIKDSDFTICAELQSIAKIRESNGDIDVYLICTDTILSPLCAEFIAKRLINNGISVNFECNNRHIIEGLIVDGVNASTTFEEKGFPNLIQIIKDIEKQANAENRPILNISGGYKALIPVMTIMGQLYDMEINYMYEDAEELIRINSLPISFDWDKGEFYLEYLKAEG
jgi:putative CRISPR-associated protein (TIGR02619 family)